MIRDCANRPLHNRRRHRRQAGYSGAMTLGDAAAEPLVHIKDFRMDFGDTAVIRDLSFDVRPGETFGSLDSVAEDPVGGAALVTSQLPLSPSCFGCWRNLRS